MCPPDFNPQPLLKYYTLDGKELLEDFQEAQLRDRTVRLRHYPLLGGVPAPDFTFMRRSPLMYEAAPFGVPTRRVITQLDGSTHRTWRPIKEVAADCAAKWAGRCATAPEAVVTTNETSSSLHATTHGTTQTSEPSSSSQRTTTGRTQIARRTDLNKEALCQQCAQRGQYDTTEALRQSWC
jgi:hypothetical protein